MITDLMTRLRRQGVKLWLNDGALKFKSYQSLPISPDDLAILKQHKSEVIQWLQHDQQQAEQNQSTKFFDYFALSENQKSLWLVYQMDPQSAAYNLTHCVELNSDIDLKKLTLAYQILLDRHAILRTAYCDIAGEPLQTLVSRDALASLAHTPLGSSAPDDLNALIKQHADLPFDLSRGEVCRAQVFTNQAANTQYLQLTLHHIAADFWSCEVVFSELLAIYADCLAAEPDLSAEASPTLSETLSETIPTTLSTNFSEASQYDYFQWSAQQQHWLQSHDAQVAAKFWQQQLANHATTLDIAGDFPRPKLQSFNGNMIHFHLSSALSDNIRAAAKALGVTPFVVGLATWQILLYRFSQQQTFTIGTPMSGRLEQEQQHTIGYLVNPVVLTCHCDPTQTFRELVAQVKQSSRQALMHQQYPLSKVMENLQQRTANGETDVSSTASNSVSSQLIRDPSRNPLFQHLFALTHVQTKRLATHQQQWVKQTLISEQRGAAVDLSLILLDDRQSFNGELRYNSDLYSQSSANTFIDSYQTLIAAVCEEVIAQPEKPRTLDELPMMSHQAWQQVRKAGVPPAVAYPDSICIHQLIEQQASEQPNAPALIAHQAFQSSNIGSGSGSDSDSNADQAAVSYQQLNQRANQLAHYLIDTVRVEPEQRIGIFQHRSIDMIISFLAVLKAGCAFVPLDPDLPAERVQTISKDADMRCFVTTTLLADALKTGSDKTDSDETDSEKNEPSNSAIICIDDEALRATLNGYRSDNIAPVSIALHSRRLAYVLYTSGSTGQPKGVMIEHQALVNQTCWIEKAYPSNLNDRFLLKTPFNFDVSLSELFGPLSAGKPIVVTHPQGHKDPVYLSQVIRDQNITRIHMVPTLLARVLANPTARANLQQSAALSLVYCCGEAVNAALADDFFATCPDTALHNLYGPTEATIFATACEITPRAQQIKDQEQDQEQIQAQTRARLQQLSIGTPLHNLQAWVLDQNRQPVAPGIEGELYLSGSGLARGYLNMPELSDACFGLDPDSQQRLAIAEPRLYRTGDRVRWLPAASSEATSLCHQAPYALQYLGRTDSQVKLRGFRIELGEIENALLNHDDVEQTCVLLENQQRLLACLVLQPAAHLQESKHLQESELIEKAEQSGDTLHQLRQTLSQQLPDYMIPSAWLILDRFPLLPSGKIDRKALAQQADSGAIIESLTVQYQAPVGNMEKLICQSWQDVLQVERVGRNDNFFALGGNSLTATKAVAIIQEQIYIQEHVQLDVPLKVWFEHPEVAVLATTLSNLVADATQQQSGVSDLDRIDSLLDELGV